MKTVKSALDQVIQEAGIDINPMVEPTTHSVSSKTALVKLADGKSKNIYAFQIPLQGSGLIATTVSINNVKKNVIALKADDYADTKLLNFINHPGKKSVTSVMRNAKDIGEFAEHDMLDIEGAPDKIDGKKIQSKTLSGNYYLFDQRLELVLAPNGLRGDKIRVNYKNIGAV
jgi:hypothetical protein